MDLNQEQRAAAEHQGEDVLVLAGAGTGKTRTLIARAAWLVAQGVEPGRILLLTFTRRAAREMVHRLRGEVGDAASRIPAGTFHRFCLATLRRMPRLFGMEDATVIDRDDQVQLMRMVRGDHRAKGERLPRAAALISAASYARNTNHPVPAYLHAHTEHDEQTIERMVACIADYERRKRQRGYLDYDDLLYLVARGMNQSAAIRDRVRSRYDHVLVDEMQDTNPLQWLILDALRAPARLFCVGDDAQSIYAFRGADFRNVHSFTERVPGSTVLKLEQNYRSTQEILDLANWLLAASPLGFDKHLTAHRGAGVQPRLVELSDEVGEAEWVVEDLVERHEQGAPWRDHMIITRTAWASRAIEAELVAQEVPYRFVGGTQLFQAAHVKDCLSLLRAAGSLRDELAWMRYLALFKGIGDRTAARMVTALAGCAHVSEAPAWLAEHRPRQPVIAEGIERVQERWSAPSEAIRAATGFLEPLLDHRYDNWTARRRDLELLARLAERHSKVEEFIETYVLEPISTSEVRRLQDEDHVVLITAHSAKGTEAPVCYLVRVEPGMYPHSRSVGDPDQEEEERRVLYVAMTRAEDELILTRTHSRAGRWVSWSTTGAYLLQDLPDGLVQVEEDGFDPWDGGLITPWRR